jgi:hypothetical protein
MAPASRRWRNDALGACDVELAGKHAVAVRPGPSLGAPRARRSDRVRWIVSDEQCVERLTDRGGSRTQVEDPATTAPVGE